HADHRALACTVVADQADDLPCVHVETDVLHRLNRPEVLRQSFAGYDYVAGLGWSARERLSRRFRIGGGAVDLCSRASLCASIRAPLIGGQSDEQRSSLNDLLPEILDSREDDSCVEHPDRENPDEDAEGVARSAGEAHPAENHRRQHVQLEADTDGRRGAAEPSDGHDRDETDHGAVKREEARDEAVDSDAAQPGGVRIAADRVRAEPADRPQQDDRRDKEADPADHDGQWNRSEVGLPQTNEPAWKTVDR